MTDNNEELPDVDWSQLDDGSGLVTISPEMLAKRILWDVTPCDMAVDVASYLNMSPASEEVEEMEHSESHQRLRGAAVLAPCIEAMSDHAARAIVGCMIVAQGDEDKISEELQQEAVDKQHAVIFQSAFAVIAEMLDIGILHLPHLGVFYVEVPDEEGPE